MRKYIGIGILAFVVIVAVILSRMNWSEVKQQTVVVPVDLKPIVINLAYTSEKGPIITNPHVTELLSKDPFKITLKATTRSSIEMVTTDDVVGPGYHCLWPSIGNAADLARSTGKTVLRDANIFSSPVVYYAGVKVVDALIAKKMIEKRSDLYFLTQPEAFLRLGLDGKSWKELGLPYNGTAKAASSDPKRSASGLISAALMASLLNKGEVVSEQSLPAVQQDVKKYFQMGFMEKGTGDIFRTVLNQGVGTHPMFVGYENQLVEYALMQPNDVPALNQVLRMIYPEPTLFASHPLLSLKPECKRLEDALLSKEFQEIAWKEHGFRTGIAGVRNDLSAIKLVKVASTLDSVIALPTPEVMKSLRDSL